MLDQWLDSLFFLLDDLCVYIFADAFDVLQHAVDGEHALSAVLHKVRPLVYLSRHAQLSLVLLRVELHLVLILTSLNVFLYLLLFLDWLIVIVYWFVETLCLEHAIDAILLGDKQANQQLRLLIKLHVHILTQLKSLQELPDARVSLVDDGK